MKKIILLQMLSLLCYACSSINPQPVSAEYWALQADTIRTQARAQFEKGQKRMALNSIKKALRISSHLTLSSRSLVELYDDAGLYFYMDKQWKEAARHQAIAVLLACNQAESAALFAEYIHRLSFAFAEYSPQQPFQPIAKNPLWLIADSDLKLNKNNDIRRRFFKTYPTYHKKLHQGKFIDKVNPDAIPDSCNAPALQ